MAPKKLPQRVCIGCKELKGKKQLLRIVRSPEGEISYDPTGKKPGRGSYICCDNECLKKAIKTKNLERSLKIKIEPAFIEQLTKLIDAANTAERKKQ